MRAAVAYCRSAVEVRGTPSSAYRQESAIVRYAKRRGLQLRATYIDAGVSGATLERPALRQLLADCRAGKIGAVVVKDKDRLSRDAVQLMVILDQFERYGVRLLFSTEAGRGGFEFEKAIWGAASKLLKRKGRRSK
jgi:site-specific DNA recombinase